VGHAELEQQWLDRIKQTMALDISRSMADGMPPKAIVEVLLRIPELRQALEMRAKGRSASMWQPIETAPEEIEILVSDGSSVETAHYELFCGKREWCSSVGGALVDKNEMELRAPPFEPTYWMPLPEPPKV
jgi:hypothetical protein